MQLNVGEALNYKGRHYICIKEEKIDILELAKEDSVSMLLYLKAGDNVKHLDFHCDEFKSGEIIRKTGERVILECPGVDVQFIYTHFEIRKENKDGIEGATSTDVEASDHEAEGLRVGDTSGEGPRPTDPGEVDSLLHGHGSSGEGGDVVYPGDGEGS